MRIPSGSTDRYVYFVAVDATDLKTRETGLTTFTVYRSRNGGAPAAMTTPTINETDVTNMPGVYELLCDEDTTLDSGHDDEEIVFHITHSGMAPVDRAIDLYRPKGTEGQAVTMASSGVTVSALTNSVITAASIAADAITDAKVASDVTIASVTGAVGSVAGLTAATVHADLDDIQTRLPAALSVGGNIKADVLSLGGVVQSLADLKDFADDGYDPATNKVQGVVLADTVTTYTGNTPQTGDNFARIGALGAGLTALASQASLNTLDDFVDTEIAAILAAVDTEIAAIPTTILDLPDGVETGLTLRQSLRLLSAACAGKASGLATATAVYRNAVADAKNRITATVDANGNRLAITYDLT